MGGRVVAAEQQTSELVGAARSGEVTYAEVGNKLGALIQHAHEWAARITAEADTEAVKTKERARQIAQKTIEEAERTAAEIRRKAEQDAAERVAYARARVAELQDQITSVAGHGAVIRDRLLAAAAALDDLDTDISLPDNIDLGASLLDLEVSDEGEEIAEGVRDDEGDAS
ncbi:MAG: hypothetical protein ACLGHL_07915 [Actinomycetota bacterium]